MFCNQPGLVLRWREEVLYLSFPYPFLCSLTSSLFQLSVPHLAQDAIEAAELQEEVTRVWAVTIMAEARAARVESMAKEKVILLASTHRKADETAWRVSFLEV
jgi:hypothetical protein